MPKRPLIWILGIWILGGAVAASLGLEPESRTSLDEAMEELSSAAVIAEGTIESVRGGESKKLVLNECAVFLPEPAPDSKPDSDGAGSLRPVFDTHKLLIYEGKNMEPDGDTADILAGLTAGMRIRISGIIRSWELPDNPGEFNVRRYYRTKGIDYSVYADELAVLEPAPEFNFGAFLDSTYADVEVLIEKLAGSPEEAGFEKAIILGDRADLSDELSMNFKISGISHVLAISGLHLSLIGMAVFRLLKKTGAPGYIAALIADLLLLFYVLMISGSASAWRAYIMFTLSLIAPLIGRSYDTLSALAIAGMLIIISRPMYLTDGGFQLSFAAIIGAGGVYPRLRSLLPKSGKPLPALNLRERLWDRLVLLRRRTAESFLFGLSIQLAVMPVTAYQYYTLSPYGLILNLIVIPLAGVMLGSYLLGAVIGSAAAAAGIFAAGPGHFIYLFLDAISSFAAKLPGASLVLGCPKLWQILLYYLLLFLALLLIERLSPKRRDKAASHSFAASAKKAESLRILLIFCMLLLPFLLLRRPSEELCITNLYVGQGDCAVVTCGGKTLLIDCGSLNRTDVGERVILPYLKYRGISKIDLICLTHSDADHISALPEILADPAVDAAAIGIPLATAAAPGWEKIKASDVILLSAGDEIELGGSLLQAIYPGSSSPLEEGNDTSLVLSLWYGDFSALFAGDIGSEVEAEIIKEGQCHAFDYLKVPHHGSKYSSSSRFLEAICPKISVISVGRGNVYGHPHENALSRITAAGSSIFRTDSCGAVTVYLAEDGDIFVSGFK